MRTQSTISTETDYLRAHLTVIDLQPRGGNLTLRDVKQRATSMLEKWTLAANARLEEIAGGIQKLMLVMIAAKRYATRNMGLQAAFPDGE